MSNKLYILSVYSIVISILRFDSSMMNGLQAVDSWDTCTVVLSPLGCSLIFIHVLTVYHSPRSAMLGLMSAMYSLGAIAALPIVPFVTDTLGRRRAIIFGSILMIIGAVLQTASQNCESDLTYISMFPLIFCAKSQCLSLRDLF